MTTQEMTDKQKEIEVENEDTVSNEGDGVWYMEKTYKKRDRNLRCMGKDGKCGQMAVAQWKCDGKKDLWETCEKCQEKDFGGWPDEFSLDEDEDNGEESVEKDNEDVTNPIEGEEEEVEEDKEEEEEDKEEQTASKTSSGSDTEEIGKEWAVEHIYSIVEIDDPKPVMCKSKKCKLVACAQWKSDADERWDTCLDCQKKDFNGWPDDQEFVIKALTDEELVGHQRHKCSKPLSKKSSSKVPDATKEQGSDVAAVTPPASTKTDKIEADADADAKQGISKASSEKRKSSKAALVSPQPVAMKKKASTQPTASALAMHRKWQEAAEAAGGKDARIVVSKGAAKKLVYDLLHDTFGVMNITEIYKALKCVVPSVVLRNCLDNMSFDATARGSGMDEDGDSDEEDDREISKNGGKSKSAEYAGSLSVKTGRNTNTTLYFLDHTKLENGGNGLSYDVKDKLVQDIQNATSTLVSLQSTVDSCNKEADALLREPTNEEADILLQQVDVAVERLKDEVELSCKLTVDEKVRKRTEKGLEAMTLHWRKRKRTCVDFLRLMDESTEGAISFKKCVAGDGQIDIESDEMIINDATERAKRKASNPTFPNKKVKVAHKMPSSGEAVTEKTDPTFIGVRLVGNGKLERVYLKEVSD